MMEQKGLKPQKCPWIGWSLRSPLRVPDSKFQCGILCPIPGSDNRVGGKGTAMALDASPMSKPNKGRPHMSGHAQSLGPVPYLVPGLEAVTFLSNRDLPWLLSAWWVHEGAARHSYGLDLDYNILYLLLTEVCFSEMMGRVACSWNSIWWMCSLNSPHPTNTQKRESEFRKVRATWGCRLLCSFAPCL